MDLDDAEDWLTEQQQDSTGVSVTYSRTGETSLTLTVVEGQAIYQNILDGGTRLEISDRDFLISVDELTYGEPEVGDRITRTYNGTSKVFEIMVPGNGEPPWRFSGMNESVYRVHTKRVS